MLQKADFAGMERFLELVDWPSLFRDKITVHQQWKVFIDIMQLIIRLYVPIVRIRPSVRKPLSREANRLWLRQKRFHREHSDLARRGLATDLTRTRWKNAAKNFEAQIRAENLASETRILNEANISKFWGWVNRKLSGGRTTVSALLKPDGSFATQPDEQCELLVNQFCSVFTEDNDLPLRPAPLDIADPLTSVAIMPQYVYASLCVLPNKTSCGPDGIPALLLKKLAFYVAAPLSLIFNTSLETSEIPRDWRLADVTPIPKAGRSPLPVNYRPISKTAQSCRNLEEIIFEALLSHFRRYNIISDAQHGFLRQRSTVTQLLLCVNDWSTMLDNNIPFDILYLDIAKAFDSVVHAKLIEKLEAVGVGGQVLAWIKNWLSDRSHHVCIDGEASEYRPVTSGVPQGSKLGPILFLLYMNDLPLVVRNATVKLFADDSKLYFAVDSVENIAQLKSDLMSIFDWAARMQLKIATQKSAVIHVGNRNPRTEYVVDDTLIPAPDCVKDLGVLITPDLKFHTHCAKISRDASATANMIFRTFATRQPDFLIKMFKVFCISKLEYASCVFNPTYLGDIDLIESVQRQFTRRLPGMGALSYLGRLIMLDLESLEHRRLQIDLIMVYKLILGLVDIPFADLFEFSHTPHLGRSHSLKLMKPRITNTVREHSFAIRVINAWNSLSETTISSANLAQFKKNLKNEPLAKFLKGLDMDRLIGLGREIP